MKNMNMKGVAERAGVDDMKGGSLTSGKAFNFNISCGMSDI